MKHSVVSVLAVFVGAALPAGSAYAQPTGNLLDARIDVVLREWSARTAQVKSLYATFDRTTIDVVFRNEEKATGSARYLYPNRARLDVDDVESYVLNGKGEIWEYKPPLKQIKVYVLPPDMANKEALEDGPLPFLFGTGAEKMKARYQLKIVDETDAAIHLSVLPKMKEDQQNFARAELWLSKDKFLPTRLAFLEPSGNQVIFNFSQVWTNIDIKATDFDCQPIRDWTFVRQQVADREADPQGVRARR